MDSAIVGAFSALAGVLVGGILETWRAGKVFKREKGWALRDERLKRLEQVYEALDQLGEAYGVAYANAVASIHHTGSMKPIGNSTKIPWARLRMLVHFYFPEFTPALADVEAAGPEMGSALARAVMHQPVLGEPPGGILDALDAAHEDLFAAVAAMKGKLVLERLRPLVTKAIRLSTGW